MKRRNFFTAALGMLLLPFVKLPAPKSALTPWVPTLHPFQAALLSNATQVTLMGGRQSGKTWVTEQMAQAGYWKVVPYKNVAGNVEFDKRGGLKWKVVDCGV